MANGRVVALLPGYFESLDYVESQSSLVASKYESHWDPCGTDGLCRLAPDGSVTPLVLTSLDNEFGVYDPVRDIFYTTDPNGARQLQRVDLLTGVATSLGQIPYELGEMAYSSSEDELYAVNDYDANTLYRITTAGGSGPISVTAVGTTSVWHVMGIAFVPESDLFYRLEVRQVGPSQAMLTWSTNATAYILEATTGLSVPAWSAVTNAPDIVGDQFAITIDATLQQQFFRLRKQ